VDASGDTKINRFQLTRIDTELDSISHEHPELGDEVRALKELVENVVRDLGYLWIIGD